MKSNLLINNLIKTENKNQTIVKNVSLVIFGTIFMSLTRFIQTQESFVDNCFLRTGSKVGH